MPYGLNMELCTYLEYVGALDVSRLVSVASSVAGHVPLCNPAVATLSLGKAQIEPMFLHFFSYVGLNIGTHFWGVKYYIWEIIDG